MTIINYINGFFDSIIQARKAYYIYNELSALSDRELADIGVKRTDIPYIAYGIKI